MAGRWRERRRERLLGPWVVGASPWGDRGFRRISFCEKWWRSGTNTQKQIHADTEIKRFRLILFPTADFPFYSKFISTSSMVFKYNLSIFIGI